MIQFTVLYYNISRKLWQPNWSQSWLVKFESSLMFYTFSITYFKSIDILKIRIFNNHWISIGDLFASLYNTCHFCYSLLESLSCITWYLSLPAFFLFLSLSLFYLFMSSFSCAPQFRWSPIFLHQPSSLFIMSIHDHLWINKFIITISLSWIPNMQWVVALFHLDSKYPAQIMSKTEVISFLQIGPLLT